MPKEIKELQSIESKGKEEQRNLLDVEATAVTVEGSQQDTTIPVIRDAHGRFKRGSSILPISSEGNRTAARKAFLDSLNGLAGERRLERIAEIAEGRAFVLGTDDAGRPVVIKPSIREQLDANTTLLYLQHGRPSVQVDVQATHNVKVRWNPDRYSRVEDLEKYLELQKIGEGAIDGQVVSEADDSEGEK